MGQDTHTPKLLRQPTRTIVAIGLAAFSALFSTDALAQSDKTITLFYEGEDGITGELLDYDGSVFKLASSIGRITVPAVDLTCIGDACPEELRLQPTLPAVTLTTLDRSTVIEGSLIDITDTEYLVATGFGEARIEIDKVSCEGEGCPSDTGQLSQDATVVLTNGAYTLSGTLVGHDSTVYILRSEALGTIRLNREEFACEGSICP